MKPIRSTFFSALLCTSMLTAHPALAEPDATTADQIKAMQQQIESMQKQLQAMQHKLKAKEAKEANVAAAPPVEAPVKTKTASVASSKSESGITIGNKNHIKLTLGGYVEAAGIAR